MGVKYRRNLINEFQYRLDRNKEDIKKTLQIWLKDIETSDKELEDLEDAY